MTAVIKSYHAVFRWWYSAKINCSKLSGHLHLWSRFVCTQLHIFIQQIQIYVNHPYIIDMSTMCYMLNTKFSRGIRWNWFCFFLFDWFIVYALQSLRSLCLHKDVFIDLKMARLVGACRLTDLFWNTWPAGWLCYVSSWMQIIEE